MFASLSALVVAGLALSANAAPGNELFKRQSSMGCARNNCVRAVGATGTGRGVVPSATRSTACQDFLLTTVTPCVGTTTETAAQVVTTTTVTLSFGETTTVQTTILSTAVQTNAATITSTTTLMFNAKMKRAPGPATGPISPPPSCNTQTSTNSTIPAYATGACANSAAYSAACACYLSTLSARTTTASVTTGTVTVTPTSVSVVIISTTMTSTTTSATTSVASTTSTSTTVVVATVQPVSADFYVTLSDGTSITVGDAASNYPLIANMANNAVFFNTDETSKLKSNGLFATVDSTADSAITLTSVPADANKITCGCANFNARTGSFTCRSSAGNTVIQVCANGAVRLALRPTAGCTAVVAQCQPRPNTLN